QALRTVGPNRQLLDDSERRGGGDRLRRHPPGCACEAERPVDFMPQPKVRVSLTRLTLIACAVGGLPAGCRIKPILPPPSRRTRIGGWRRDCLARRDDGFDTAQGRMADV